MKFCDDEIVSIIFFLKTLIECKHKKGVCFLVLSLLNLKVFKDT